MAIGNGSGENKKRGTGVSDIPGEVRRRMNRNEQGMAAKILVRHLEDVERKGVALLVDEGLMRELLTEAVNRRGMRLRGDEGRALLALARFASRKELLGNRDRVRLVRSANERGYEKIADALAVSS